MFEVLRPGLLDGLSLTLAAAGAPGPAGEAVARRCGSLGATVSAIAVDPAGAEGRFPQAADVLVWDGARPPDGAAAVAAALDGAWTAIRPVVTGPMAAAGGKLVLLAPAPGGPHAQAVRAGLENLARTTSVEWARRQIRTVAVLPGRRTAPEVVAELVAYVASHAGDYYSGCAFELGAADGS